MRLQSKLSHRRAVAGQQRSANAGFTLIEMVVVISLILVLLAIALPMYQRSIQNAREATFRSNMMNLNHVIQEYSQYKRRAPQTLDEVVQAGYYKFIPNDITGRPDTWVTEPEDSDKAWDPNQPGIGWVHSGSNEIGSDGRPYSEWR